LTDQQTVGGWGGNRPGESSPLHHPGNETTIYKQTFLDV